MSSFEKNHHVCFIAILLLLLLHSPGLCQVSLNGLSDLSFVKEPLSLFGAQKSEISALLDSDLFKDGKLLGQIESSLEKLTLPDIKSFESDNTALSESIYDLYHQVCTRFATLKFYGSDLSLLKNTGCALILKNAYQGVPSDVVAKRLISHLINSLEDFKDEIKKAPKDESRIENLKL